MYKVALPFVSELCFKNQQEALKEAQDFNGERIMLSIGVYEQDPKNREKCLKELAENCKFFKAHGYEVGAWIWTFLFRAEFSTEDGRMHPFTRIKDSAGAEFNQSACPMDEDFINFAAEYIQDVAKTGVDMIMFDDDFGYGYCRTSNISCFCDLHLARIREILGEDIPTEELIEHIMKDPKNKYRDAFLQANGESLENFARRMREAVDIINPNVRMGYCTCMNSWDVDGTDAKRMSYILAGNTKPFCRLTGAPYWVNPHWVKPRPWSQYLQDVVEFVRLESSWTSDGEIELFSEGDTFPRPRYHCPAAFLEGYDMALRAAGCLDGILKYGIDYVSNPNYENGYRKFHKKNLPTYEWIHKHFDGKTPCGVRIYESMKKIADCTPYTAVNDGMDYLDNFFSRAVRAIAYNATPTVYEGKGVTGVVFDESARHLPEDAFDNGLIIDVAAAEILTEKGIDVGLKRIGEKINAWGLNEYFYKTDNQINSLSTFIHEMEVSDKAQILSVLKKGNKEYPMCYLYENANGQRFMVFAINTRASADAFRPYARNQQIAESVEWLGGKKLPAHVNGFPALYMICKEGNGKLSIGLWNFIEDIAIEPVIDLAETWAKVECFGGTAKLDGDKILLSDIPAFGFIGIELSK